MQLLSDTKRQETITLDRDLHDDQKMKLSDDKGQYIITAENSFKLYQKQNKAIGC